MIIRINIFYCTIIFLFLLTVDTIAQQPQWSKPTDAYRQILAATKRQSPSSGADTTLSIVGRWAWGPCYAVDVKGSYAFIGNGPTFQVLDISNPLQPTIAAEYVTESRIKDIRLRDTLAFICGGKGFLIINIANPFLPTKVGELNIPATLRVIPTDSFAYVTNFSSFGVIDVTDPTNPRTRSVVGAGGDNPSCLAVKDRFVYIGNPEFPDLKLVDATNPDSLKQLDYVQIGGWGISAYLRDTLLLVGVAGFDGNQSLKIYSVTNTVFPVELGQVAVGFTRSYEINSITINGHYAFAAIEGHGVIAIDISDPTRPQIIDSLYKSALTSNLGFSISSLQGTVYAAFYSGLLVLNTTRPDSLNEETFFIAGGYGPLDIALDSQIAYVAVGNAGLAVLDISDPTMPVRVGAIMLPGNSISIAIDSVYAFVGGENIQIVNIANPQTPKNIGYIPINGTPIDIYIENKRLYVLVADSGTLVFDISNPLEPTQIGYTTFGGHRLVVRGGTTYFAGGSGGLVIVDMSDPQNPIMISRVLNWVGGIVVKDSLAFAATDVGLAIVSIATPSNPRVLSAIATPGTRTYIDMALSGKFLYLSYSYLIAVDISNPYSPVIVGDIPYMYGHGVASIGANAFLCVDNGGLFVFRNSLITSVRSGDDKIAREYLLLQNFPNPFNPRTTIEFSIPRQEHIVLEVYNVMGQRIGTLIKGSLGAGKHLVVFDGSSLPSGVYYYRLITRGGYLIKRMVIIR